MRSTVLFTVLMSVLGACRIVPPGHASGGGAARARSDTVSILTSVWRAAAAGHEGLRVARLYLPAADTAALTTSEEVRAALRQRGVPALERLPAGDDTVVFRVRHWVPDSSGAARLEVWSSWTTVLGARRSWQCRTGSGNTESYRAVRTSAGWTAESVGPITHGDRLCAPIP